MPKTRLVYIMSLRNAAADKAGQQVSYKEETRYMTSPLEYLANALDETALGEQYSLEGIIYDDDMQSAVDCAKVKDYGFTCGASEHWVYPKDLQTQGRTLNDLMHNVPSSYRRYPLDAAERKAGKSLFEKNLLEKLLELRAEIVVLDGLLVILDELVRPGALFHRKIVNIHPGITRLDSPFERRGAYATLDALHGARGEKVTDWQTMQITRIPPINKTGASFHYVDNGIDSGEVIVDVLNTSISPEDTILELRWNNFNDSLFPALYQGLLIMSEIRAQSADHRHADPTSA